MEKSEFLTTIASLFTISLILAFIAWPVIPRPAPDFHDGAYNVGMKMTMKIYRNGELVYEKPGDPLLDNFIVVFSKIMAGDAASIAGVQAKISTGAYVTAGVMSELHLRYAYVELLNATVNITRDMYTVPSTNILQTIPTTQVQVTYNQTTRTYMVSILASATASAAYTVYTVAMRIHVTYGIYADNDPSSVYGKDIYIIVDTIPSGIQVNAGDQVTVQYIWEIVGGV